MIKRVCFQKWNIKVILIPVIRVLVAAQNAGLLSARLTAASLRLNHSSPLHMHLFPVVLSHIFFVDSRCAHHQIFDRGSAVEAQGMSRRLLF
jgi:hypothetical protein